MTANTESTMLARILWHVALAAIPAEYRVSSLRDASDDTLAAMPERIGATHGAHAEGEAQSALLNYRMARGLPAERAAYDADMLAHCDALAERYAPHVRALRALQDATGAEPSDDDVGMVLNASASELADWESDLAERVGLDTADLADALRPLQVAAFDRESEMAHALLRSLLSPEYAAVFSLDTADPRGETDGGADVSSWAGDGFGLHRAPSHVGGGWYVYNTDGRADTDCTLPGGSLDADKARAALAAMLRDALPAAAAAKPAGEAQNARIMADNMRENLSPRAAEILARVNAALQDAEGMHGPEDYTALMHAVHAEANARILAARVNGSAE